MLNEIWQEYGGTS